MRYDVYVDFKTIKDTTYTNHIGKLTDSLAKCLANLELTTEKYLMNKEKRKSIFLIGKRFRFRPI
jgi:cell division protein FtsI (penicillin-binding protein 3)